MQHIENEFNQVLQYVCISSPNEPQVYYLPPPPLVYIQIILQKATNKKSYFLKRVAGLNDFY